MPKFQNDSLAERFKTGLAELGWPLVALMAVALVFGGGGIRHGLTNLVVQLAALAFLLFQPGLLNTFLSKAPRWLIALVAASFLVPLLHLVPLPADVWRALPGREMAAETRDLIGSGDGWYPITLDRARTVIALISLVGPLAVIVASGRFSESTGRNGLALIVGLALLQFVFGVLQFASGGDALYLYETNEVGRFYGFFIGHIASGLFLVIGLCALVGHYASKRRGPFDNLLYPALGALLSIGVILTESRSAVALLAVPLGWATWLAWKELRTIKPKIRFAILGGVAVAVLAIGAVMATNQRLGDTWERFSSFEDSRPDIWTDTRIGIDRYWPVGSGMGTFDEVFQVEESLETLTAKKAGRAHNEYIEIALEAGLPGILLIAAWILALAYATVRGLRSVHAPVTMAAALALVCVALQGLIYFPLRNMAVLCVAGLLVALLTAPVTSKRDRVIE